MSPESAFSATNPPFTSIFACKINLHTCFPETLGGASKAFTRVAFENPECGDCSTWFDLTPRGVLIFAHILMFSICRSSVIRALVTHSGSTGLEALLPPAARTVKYTHPSPVVDKRDPFLPLAESWTKIDFEMGKVLAPWARLNATSGVVGVNVREWVMRAMARYRFVLGMFHSCSSLSAYVLGWTG
jgi:hypothetical protein